MPLLDWKERNGILVTCYDCEFWSDCNEIPEDAGVCRDFTVSSEVNK